MNRRGSCRAREPHVEDLRRISTLHEPLMPGDGAWCAGAGKDATMWYAEELIVDSRRDDVNSADRISDTDASTLSRAIAPWPSDVSSPGRGLTTWPPW